MAVPGSDYILGGPLFWVLTVTLFGTAMLAVFVVIDCIRRSFTRGDRPAEQVRWHYLVPQAVYVFLLLVGQVGAMPMAVTAAVVLATPVLLAQGITYLLRVVFPKPVEEEAPVSLAPVEHEDAE